MLHSSSALLDAAVCSVPDWRAWRGGLDSCVICTHSTSPGARPAGRPAATLGGRRRAGREERRGEEWSTVLETPRIAAACEADKNGGQSGEKTRPSACRGGGGRRHWTPCSSQNCAGIPYPSTRAISRLTRVRIQLPARAFFTNDLRHLRVLDLSFMDIA